MNKKKILSIALTVLVLCSVAGLFVFYNQRHERYDGSDKSSIAMGTILTQKVYGDFAGKHIEKIKNVVDGLDDMISWRENTSEIARLNAGETLEIAYLADVIRQCGEVSAQSNGVFDITVGGISRLWNIGEENERIPTDKEWVKTKSAFLRA